MFVLQYTCFFVVGFVVNLVQVSFGEKSIYQVLFWRRFSYLRSGCL